MRLAIALAAAVGLLVAPAHAQQPQAAPPTIGALQNCQRIQDNAARLVCYDRAAAALVGAVSAGEVAVVDREQVRSARRSLFGFTLPDFPFFGGRKDDPRDEEPKELVTKLASFSSIGNGRYRIGVEEGNALWETTESAPIYDPERGDQVTIKRGVLGSYFVQVDGGRWVRARRVR